MGLGFYTTPISVIAEHELGGAIVPDIKRACTLAACTVPSCSQCLV